MNANYEATPEEFTKVLDDAYNQRMQSATKILMLRIKMKELMTVEEWKAFVGPDAGVQRAVPAQRVGATHWLLRVRRCSLERQRRPDFARVGRTVESTSIRAGIE